MSRAASWRPAEGHGQSDCRAQVAGQNHLGRVGNRQRAAIGQRREASMSKMPPSTVVLPWYVSLLESVNRPLPTLHQAAQAADLAR